MWVDVDVGALVGVQTVPAGMARAVAPSLFCSNGFPTRPPPAPRSPLPAPCPHSKALIQKAKSNLARHLIHLLTALNVKGTAPNNRTAIRSLQRDLKKIADQ